MKKVRRADSRDGWYLIEPADAQALLDEQPPNRPLRESKAVKFSRAMVGGKWRQNGEPLILDEREKLLDGQGRCRACVISGKSFTTYIVHGIPRSMFSSVDTGQNRGGGDTLSMAGGNNCVLASAVCWLAIACSQGSPTAQASRGSITNDEILSYYKKNTDRVERAITDLQGHFKVCPLPPSILCYVYMEALAIDEEKAMSWALGIALGEKLSSGSPILVLRNRLIALKGDAHKLTQFEKLALAIKSWNAFLEGRNLSLIKWNRKGKAGRNAEPFPVMGAEL